jgi:hypothetical protein
VPLAVDRLLMKALGHTDMSPLGEAMTAAYHAEQASPGVLLKGMNIDRVDDVVPRARPRGLECHRPPSPDPRTGLCRSRAGNHLALRESAPMLHALGQRRLHDRTVTSQGLVTAGLDGEP